MWEVHKETQHSSLGTHHQLAFWWCVVEAISLLFLFVHCSSLLFTCTVSTCSWECIALHGTLWTFYLSSCSIVTGVANLLIWFDLMEKNVQVLYDWKESRLVPEIQTRFFPTSSIKIYSFCVEFFCPAQLCSVLSASVITCLCEST